jgi:hypothetical protein
MLILKTLALEPMHDYGVALREEQINNGVYRVNPARCFLLSAEWSAQATSSQNGGLRKTTAAPGSPCLPRTAAGLWPPKPSSRSSRSQRLPACLKHDTSRAMLTCEGKSTGVAA